MTNTNKKYLDFVLGVMSDPSKNYISFLESLQSLQSYGNSKENNKINVPMLLTAGLGLPGEAGEVSDLIKKILFQGKPFNEELREKLESEISDCMWYIAAACMALNTDIDKIIKRNMDKLSSRYKDGKFSIEQSENRKATDF